MLDILIGIGIIGISLLFQAIECPKDLPLLQACGKA